MTAAIIVLQVLVVLFSAVVAGAAFKLHGEVGLPTQYAAAAGLLAVTGSAAAFGIHPLVGVVGPMAAVVVTAMGLRGVDQAVLATSKARAAAAAAAAAEEPKSGPNDRPRKTRKAARVQHQGRVTKRLD